jgi:hypothetical protein
MVDRVLWAYAHGTDGSWEATCTDLDISVQGADFEEVRALLAEAVSSYIEDALKETPRDAERLLNRRAPWWVRFRLATRFLGHIGSPHRRQPREFQAGFDIPCHA